MNGKPCASTDKTQSWETIDWKQASAYVKKLQMRIVKAQKEGHFSKVKSLQWLLTHSFYAKALAVKRVTSNQGKNTSGVDHENIFVEEEVSKLPTFSIERYREYEIEKKQEELSEHLERMSKRYPEPIVVPENTETAEEPEPSQNEAEESEGGDPAEAADSEPEEAHTTLLSSALLTLQKENHRSGF